ncbi:hypothetical protein ACQY1Q_00265 [Tenacibaculum sp. TC6]|uniref:hypothetical protein n=1 Tax=Tenacibaculum sp. TC6 TaxID=3423223 RepID=UPI003D36B227
MANDLESFFKTNDFDIHEPHSGHLERFKRKLNLPKKKSPFPWQWLSIAASVILVLGFYLGQMQRTNISLTEIAPNMAETESFFMTTIKQELKEIEKHRNIETETLIEDALDEIEELEEQYQTFIKELSKNNNKKLMIQNLINNYQQRLTVLENLLTKLEYQRNPTKFELKYDEII